MDDGGVPRELIVLVEYMQAEAPVGVPVVHRFEGDEGEPLVDRQLRDLGVLHAVGPAPHRLPVAKREQIDRLHLGQKDHLAALDQLGAAENSSHVRSQVVIRHVEFGSVAGLDEEGC